MLLYSCDKIRLKNMSFRCLRGKKCIKKTANFSLMLVLSVQEINVISHIMNNLKDKLLDNIMTQTGFLFFQ